MTFALIPAWNGQPDPYIINRAFACTVETDGN